MDKYTKFMLLNARVECAGASEAGIKLSLYEVLQEFLDFTSLWDEAIAFASVPDVTDYPIVPVEVPPGQIIRLVSVYDANTVPKAAMMPTLGVVTLRDTPNTGEPLTAAVTKSVTLDACSCNDGIPELPLWIMQRWMPCILHGLLAKMMLQQGKPYANQALGGYHKHLHDRDASLARGQKLRRNTYGTNAWVYPQAWRTHGQRGGVSVGNPTEF